jgi:hypothetical protein
VVEAIGFARSIAKDVTAVYVELEPGSGERIREEWQAWWPDVPIAIVPSPYPLHRRTAARLPPSDWVNPPKTGPTS